jgi:hypothetical protein
MNYSITLRIQNAVKLICKLMQRQKVFRGYILGLPLKWEREMVDDEGSEEDG